MASTVQSKSKDMATRQLSFPTVMSEKALAAAQPPTGELIPLPGHLTTKRGCSPDPEVGSLFIYLLPHSQSLDPPLDGLTTKQVLTVLDRT